MGNLNILRGRFWLVYPAWIVLCIVLFLAMQNLSDGSRPQSRIGTDEATRRAVEILHQVDRRYLGFTAVHTSFARGRIDGSPDRWIVLCDRPARSGLRESVVVELTADGRRVVRIRKPVL